MDKNIKSQFLNKSQEEIRAAILDLSQLLINEKIILKKQVEINP